MSFFYFIVGACFGSFIPCFAERRYHKASQIQRSHCVNCGTPIAPIDLIPILGYFLCHGHCRYCHAPIPKCLPCFELLGAMVGLLFSLHAVHVVEPMITLLIASMLLLMSLDDYHTQWIHDSDLLIYGILILFEAFSFNPLFFSERIIGALIIALPLLFIYWRFPDALGSGDIIFMALSGFLLGLIHISYAFLIGILAALLYSGWLLEQHRATRETAIPLIPFLSIGVLTMMLF